MSLSVADRTIEPVPNSDDTAWSVRHYRARLSGRPEFNEEIPAIQPSLAAVGALGPGAHLSRGYQETMDFALHLHALIDGKQGTCCREIAVCGDLRLGPDYVNQAGAFIPVDMLASSLDHIAMTGANRDDCRGDKLYSSQREDRLRTSIPKNTIIKAGKIEFIDDKRELKL